VTSEAEKTEYGTKSSRRGGGQTLIMIRPALGNPARGKRARYSYAEKFGQKKPGIFSSSKRILGGGRGTEGGQNALNGFVRAMMPHLQDVQGRNNWGVIKR